ncbi:hypothetical protein CMT89_11920 [Elizabethkingia anophelis]|uniref:Uncharacterized protein n=1 Tax=Chryseobacterium shandongense TaxID=1493872 RepID=A0ABM7BBR5_9FLAO|nr:hypothetical protein [Elizabethkingia miricola]AMR40108.1 hypothetical protein A2T74_01490 [Elizabethkingia anophelis]AZA58624.1 hypothetical protein EG350_16160 [Chryseobacterium shandongense]KFF76098.1 hypothetical protein HX13_01835 [Chryseobacterium sp. P1-3]AMX46743.1 hypothetical protein A4C56_01490 [Elizabethkingia anophelis]AMX50205.1 hypothetical protein A2T72_01490 [Elizabethkingia anophelis]
MRKRKNNHIGKPKHKRKKKRPPPQRQGGGKSSNNKWGYKMIKYGLIALVVLLFLSVLILLGVFPNINVGNNHRH